jgi:hypothetical protein
MYIYLLGVDDVHDDAALEHARETGLDGEVVLAIAVGAVVAVAVAVAVGGEFSRHCMYIVDGVCM